MKKIFFVLCMGIAASIIASFAIKQWEESKRQQEFDIRAQGHTAAIRAGFDSIAKQLEDMRFLIEFDINSEKENPKQPEDFMRMLTPIITHEPSILDIDWAVPTTDGHAQVIYSWKDKSQTEKHDIVPDLHPISAHFIQDGEQKNYLQLIAPITNHINDINQGNALQGNIIAWLISEWDVASLVEQALKHTPVSAQDIYIRNLDKNGNMQQMYFHPSRSRTAEEKDTHTQVSHVDSFPYLGMNIQVEYEAAPKFLRDFPIVLAWQTLLMGLLATLLITWFVYRREQYTEHIEQEVKQRTQALQQSHDKIRRIIDNLQDIYYQMDLEGNITMVSPSISSLGYTPQEVVGTNMLDYCSNPQDFKNLMVALQECADGQLQNHHLQVKHHNGETRWVSLNAQYMYDDKHKVIGVEGTLRDFTQSKQNQEKVQQKDKLELLGLMAGGIAHNFNNILTSILGNASIARMNALDHDVDKHLNAIEDASERAATICKQMLAYAGKGRFVDKNLNVSHAIEDIGSMLQASFSNAGELTYHLATDIPDIPHADPSQIQQLVIDLVHNAIESYEGEYGVVTVETGVAQLSELDMIHCIDQEHLQPGQYVYIRVSDQGCGIPEDQQTHVFEPFASTKFTGRGLGLSAVRGIARAHGGTVLLESEEGKGTTITVFFPVETTPLGSTD